MLDRRSGSRAYIGLVNLYSSWAEFSSKYAIQLSAVDLARSASALVMLHCCDSRSQAASMVSSRLVRTLLTNGEVISDSLIQSLNCCSVKPLGIPKDLTSWVAISSCSASGISLPRRWYASHKYSGRRVVGFHPTGVAGS